ncbi:MAG: ABC transporter permease subunit [Lachnospiraceae bacterium]|nr:ABC transporter permease subunit [Candidatus Merdinaster equi]
MNKTMRKRALLVIIASTMVFLAACGNNIVPKSSVENKDTLAGASIGVQVGTTGEIYAADYEEKGATVIGYNKINDAILALKQGKVDCVIIDEEPAKNFVSLNRDIEILPEELVTEDYAICVEKSNTALLEDINRALAILEENGTLESIRDNYIGANKGMSPYVSPDDIVYDGTLVMATNGTFPPYEYIESGNLVGIDVDMATAVCDILGKKLEIMDIEFGAILPAVQAGKADMGIAGMTVTEERLQSASFSNPYTTSTQVIIVRNGESDVAPLFSYDRFKRNFIDEGRWQYIVNGLWVTIRISFVAVILGIIFGFLLAIGRFTCDKTGKCKILNFIMKAYINIIRGIPAVIQLLIIYYVVFASTNIDAVLVATIAFGINSSAYVAEILRSGLESIDGGQFEAGRSIGFTYAQTMRIIILPQAIRNVLPALGNEFIVLLKETSIAGYIGIRDLTRQGDNIRSATYDAFMPLIAVALIYLIIVMFLSMLVSKMERRLKKDAR